MRKGGRTATRTEHRTLRNPTRKTRWSEGERYCEAKGNSDGWTGSSRGREIGIGKNKAWEGTRERERHAKQVPKRVSRFSIFLRPLPLPRLLMMRLTPARGSWSRWNCGYIRDTFTYFLLIFFFLLVTAKWNHCDGWNASRAYVANGRFISAYRSVGKELFKKICNIWKNLDIISYIKYWNIYNSSACWTCCAYTLFFVDSETDRCLYSSVFNSKDRYSVWMKTKCKSCRRWTLTLAIVYYSW